VCRWSHGYDDACGQSSQSSTGLLQQESLDEVDIGRGTDISTSQRLSARRGARAPGPATSRTRAGQGEPATSWTSAGLACCAALASLRSSSSWSRRSLQPCVFFCRVSDPSSLRVSYMHDCGRIAPRSLTVRRSARQMPVGGLSLVYRSLNTRQTAPPSCQVCSCRKGSLAPPARMVVFHWTEHANKLGNACSHTFAASSSCLRAVLRGRPNFDTDSR
jgi:hypothetical protein